MLYVRIWVKNLMIRKGFLGPDGLMHSLWSKFSYFNYVTLATLGYGDVTPLTRFARAWSILETLIGQFYLALVVARLIGLFITNQR